MTSAIEQLIIWRNLSKIINCYCADCVGRTSCGTAPLLINLYDKPLGNPDGCMCVGCLEHEHAPSTKLFVSSDVDTTGLKCPCYECMGPAWDKYPVKQLKPLEVLKITKNRYFIINTEDIKFFNINEHKNRRYNLSIGDSRNKKYVAFVPWYKLGWRTDESYIPDDIIRCFNQSKTNAGKCHNNHIRNPRDMLPLKKVYLNLQHKKYFYRAESSLYFGFRFEDLSDKSPDELYESGVLQKILYYEEYSGYYVRPDGYSIMIENNDAITSFETVIKYRDVPHKKIIGKRDAREIFKILDTYCRECNKYKGACLGHDIPDEDEYGNIRRSIQKMN